MMANELLKPEEMRAINDAMPSEAKYGEVFGAIAKAQLAKDEKLIEENKLLYSLLADKEVSIGDAKSLIEMWRKEALSLRDKVEQARQEGRQEVVDWIKKGSITPLGKDPYGYYVWESILQAKLKEWRLK